MAFVISVVLLKGGVSKTTTALALGEAAALSMPVVIVDMHSTAPGKLLVSLTGW